MSHDKRRYDRRGERNRHRQSIRRCLDVQGYPEQFGIERQSLDAITVRDAAHSLALINEALGGTPGAAFDMVALNAGATIYAADLADSLSAGVDRAREVLGSGQALAKLQQLAAFSSGLGEEA